jgi:hypothetical protein
MLIMLTKPKDVHGREPVPSPKKIGPEGEIPARCPFLAPSTSEINMHAIRLVTYVVSVDLPRGTKRSHGLFPNLDVHQGLHLVLL